MDSFHYKVIYAKDRKWIIIVIIISNSNNNNRKLTSAEHLLGICIKQALHLFFLSPHNNPVRWTLLMCLFYKSSEMLGHVHNVEFWAVQYPKAPWPVCRTCLYMLTWRKEPPITEVQGQILLLPVFW